VLGIVNNDISNDTRVKRVAASAAASGFKSIVLGFTKGSDVEFASMGDVQIIKVPVPLEYEKGRVKEISRFKRLVPRFKKLVLHLLSPNFMAPIKALLKRFYQFIKKGYLKRLVKRSFTSVIRLLVKFVSIVPQAKSKLESTKVSRSAVSTIRRLTIRDFERHYGKKIIEAKPDLIHAHDFHMIGVAVEAARKLRLSGHEVKVVYDAHELVEGLDHLDTSVQEYWLSYESQYIHEVDGIVCVSAQQAERLQMRYQLSEKPTVILNCPILDRGVGCVNTIRDDLGIIDKILVYHGKASIARGLEVFVESLKYLDEDAHIALVVNTKDPFIKELKELAFKVGRSRPGASERLHFLPYVPAEDLPEYLSTADIAVIPLLPTGNHEVAMPNKLFEAIQAKLPVLSSERRALTEFINHNAIGLVYADNDPSKLAAAANTMLQNLEHYKQALSSDFTEKYSWGVQSEELIRTYCELLGVKTILPLAISHRDIVI
tara:strand:- start:3156 stop:4619 length:1464 start_codon:yes stop_codon:yes gene_type:complete